MSYMGKAPCAMAQEILAKMSDVDGQQCKAVKGVKWVKWGKGQMRRPRWEASSQAASELTHLQTRLILTLKGRRGCGRFAAARAHGLWTYEPRQGRKAATVVCSASAVVTLAFEF